jgi:hypothetical protein
METNSAFKSTNSVLDISKNLSSQQLQATKAQAKAANLSDVAGKQADGLAQNLANSTAGAAEQQVLNRLQSGQMSEVSMADILKEKRVPIEVVQKVAKDLLAIPEDKVQFPLEMLNGTYGSNTADARKANLKTRAIALKALASGKLLKFSLDMDGNITMKTSAKTQDSASNNSIVAKTALRIIAYVSHMIGGGFEVNTQRVGILESPSVLGSMGEDRPFPLQDLIDHYKKEDKVDDKAALRLVKQNYKNVDEKLGIVYVPTQRNRSEISSARDELAIYNTKDPLHDMLGMKGLGSAIIHEPGKPLKVNPKALMFAEVIESMDKTHNFTKEFSRIVKKNALRVQEFKSLPDYITEHDGEVQLDHYLKLTEITDQAIKNKVPDAKLAQLIREEGIPLNAKYSKLLDRLANPEDREVTAKTFINAARKGKVFCLVPHTISPDNIFDTESKLELTKLIMQSIRAPETKKFIKEKYGLDPENVVNINNKNISDIDFSGDKPKNTKTGQVYQTLNDLCEGLKSAEDAPESAIFKVIVNSPPYMEFTANTNKQDGLPPIEKIKENNEFFIGGGDSPSDSALLAHSLLAGGAGFIARGMIDEKGTLIKEMVNMLTKDKYQSHEFALTKNPDKTFTFKKTGEILPQAKVVDKLYNVYKDKINRQGTVPDNVAAMASVMLEVAQALKIPGLDKVVGLADPKAKSFKADPNANWVKQFIATRKQEKITAPLITGLDKNIVQENMEKGGYAKAFKDESSLNALIAKIPLLGKLVALDKPSGAFKALFGIVAAGMATGAAVGTAGLLTNKDGLVKAGKVTQKASYIPQAATAMTAFYMMNAHKFTLKTVGEGFGLLSTMFPKGSFMESLLRPLSEINMAGISAQENTATNMNINQYQDMQAARSKFKNPDKFIDPRTASTELTEKRNEEINFFRDQFAGGALGKMGMPGRFLSRVVPDVKQALTLTKQFIEEPGLRKGVLTNMLPNTKAGVGMRTGKENGQPYMAPHSQAHILAATATATAGTAVLAAVAHRSGAKKVGDIMAGIANFLPTIALANRAKQLALNVSGEPISATGLHGEQINFNPKKAANLQLLGAYLMGAGGLGRGLEDSNPILSKLHALSGFTQNLGLGALVLGMVEEFSTVLDDAEFVKTHQQGQTFKALELNKMGKADENLVNNIVKDPNYSANNIVPLSSRKTTPAQANNIAKATNLTKKKVETGARAAAASLA